MQYIYTMIGVSKIVPPKREIIKDISLSFFPGAKIGLLGLNGSGKSTVLRIMAGVDNDFNGEARPQPDIKIGFLPQEPQLDPEKTVRESRRGRRRRDLRGADAARRRLCGLRRGRRRFRQARRRAAASRGDPRHERCAHARAHARNRRRCAAPAAVGREDRQRSPAARSAASRCAACCCPSPTCCCSTSRPTISTPNRSSGSRHFLANFPGTVVAVTHDRYFLDNAAEWILELDRGRGIPWKGNYSSWLEQKDARLQQEEAGEKARRKAIQRELEWVRQGAKGRQSKGKARLNRFEELNSVEYQQRNETNEIYIPPGERLGDLVVEFKNVSKSFGDRMLIDDLSLQGSAGRDRRHHRPERRRQVDVLQADHRRREAGQAARSCMGTTVQARLRRPVARFARRRRRTSGRKSPAAPT